MHVQHRSWSRKSSTRTARKGCLGCDKSTLANLKCSFTFVCNSRIYFKLDTRMFVWQFFRFLFFFIHTAASHLRRIKRVSPRYCVSLDSISRTNRLNLHREIETTFITRWFAITRSARSLTDRISCNCALLESDKRNF